MQTALSHIPLITKLSKNVVRILGCNPGFYTLQGTNTYMIGSESSKSRILLDTGEKNNHDYLNLLNQYSVENDIKISSIIVSHWHPDHIGGVPNLVENLNLKGVKVYKMRHEKDIDYKFDYINEEIVLNESGVSLRLIPSPGHTSDHLIAYLEDENIGSTIFSCDCLLGEGSSVFEDLGDYLNSLRLMLKLEPKIIYPGHGKVIENPVERINENINHRLKREKMILDQLSIEKPLSANDIVDLIYKDIPKQLYEGAIYNVTNHFNQLVKDGKVKELIDNEKNLKVYLKTY